MGTVAAHTARATFATNLFAAGGVAVEVGRPDRRRRGRARGVRRRSAVVCLAGTDAAYAEWGADLVAALREAGATHVIVAGEADRRRSTTPARWASTRSRSSTTDEERQLA